MNSNFYYGPNGSKKKCQSFGNDLNGDVKLLHDQYCVVMAVDDMVTDIKRDTTCRCKIKAPSGREQTQN